MGFMYKISRNMFLMFFLKLLIDVFCIKQLFRFLSWYTEKRGLNTEANKKMSNLKKMSNPVAFLEKF